MDLFGIQMMFEQKILQYKKWLRKPIGTYTNRDVVVDILQMVVIVLQAAVILLR